MSELVVRLDTDLYTAGDTIYGAVYLKIDGPTSGYGIKVSIKGLERYVYHDVRRLSGPRLSVGEGCVLQENVVVLDEQLILCLRKSPFAIGQYVLPFKQPLPQHLPGSFEQRSWHGPKWEAQVSYQVTAEVIGSERIKTIIPLKINALFECTPDPLLQVQHRVSCSRVLRSLKTTFYMTVRLDKTGYSLGETARIMVQINSTDTPLKHIYIKLLRSLQLVKDINSQTDSSVCKLCNPKWGDYVEAATNTDTEDTSVWPEDGPTIVWSAFLSNDKAMQGRSSGNFHLSSSQVPTVFMLLSSDHQGFGLQPSIHSNLLQCHYSIQVEVELEVGDKVTVDVPLPYVGLKKTSSTSCEERDWMRSCVAILPDNFGKGEHWTDWGVYTKSHFPTLSVMRSPSSRRRRAGKERSVPLSDFMSMEIVPSEG